MYRSLLSFTLLIIVAGLWLAPESNAQSNASLPPVKVYKEPNCDCCTKWVDYMRDNGFQVQVVAADVIRMKRKLHVPKDYAACHTAEIAGYGLEGHIPIAAIKLLLIQKPDLAGLAVPGMPIGSPGMEGAGAQHYNVMGYYKNGEKVLFMKF